MSSPVPLNAPVLDRSEVGGLDVDVLMFDVLLLVDAAARVSFPALVLLDLRRNFCRSYPRSLIRIYLLLCHKPSQFLI